MLFLRHKLFWILLFITVLQTALVLQYSARQGRLALPVYFDDNHSLVDGARRLEIWQQHGVTALFKDYRANLPHAPGHSAIALISFSIFGLHAWAPYLTNALFFALILYALHLALIGIDDRLQGACLLLLATTPIAGLSILEFRSEVNVAELGATGILLFIAWSGSIKRLMPLLLSALCFAACFIIKPAVFPYTFGLMGLCVLYHLRLFLKPMRERVALLDCLLPIGLFLLVAIAPPLPHYLLDWRHITEYIGAIALSSTSVWLRHDDFVTGLLFNLTGYPGRIMLGAFLKPAVTLIIAGVLVRYFRRSSWPLSLPFLPLIYFTLGAYVGVAVNPMNQNYFGMTFHWLLLITSLVALCGIITTLLPKYLTASFVLVGIVAVVTFFGFKFPLSIDFFREKAGSDSAVFSWLQKSPELIMELIRKEYVNNGATKVWITAYTMINARTLEWYSLLNREPFLYRDFIESDWNAVPPSLEWADIVVVPEKGTPSLETIIPNAAMTERMVAQLDHDPRFRLIESIPSPHSGPGFRIYSKQSPLPSQ